VLKKISVLIVFLFIFAFSSSPTYALVLAGSKTITSDRDASFFSKFPTETFGTVNYLSVLNNSTGIVWSWLHFNLNTIPENATITSATLKLYVRSSGSNVNGTVIDIYQNTVDAYNESSTWNAVALGGPKLPNTLNYTGTSTVETSVTDAVKAWWAGTAVNKGLVLTTSTSGGYCMFHSREEGTSMPTLIVNYTTPLNIIIPNLSTPTPTQTPQVQATPTPTPTLAPSQTPTPTAVIAKKTSPTPTTETLTPDSGNPDGTVQETPAEEPKNENKITFSITANMVVAALMILAGLVIIGLFVWLLKKKSQKESPSTESTAEENSKDKEEEVKEESKDKEAPKENEEK
jgi:cell division septation protein DedD